jgi:hypothetical protein
MSARLHSPLISRRTWIRLILADGAIWMIAEIQHSGGSLRAAFDAVWVASFFSFILLVAAALVAAVQSRRRARMTRLRLQGRSDGPGWARTSARSGRDLR